MRIFYPKRKVILWTRALKWPFESINDALFSNLRLLSSFDRLYWNWLSHWRVSSFACRRLLVYPLCSVLGWSRWATGINPKTAQIIQEVLKHLTDCTLRTTARSKHDWM